MGAAAALAAAMLAAGVGGPGALSLRRAPAGRAAGAAAATRGSRSTKSSATDRYWPARSRRARAAASGRGIVVVASPSVADLLARACRQARGRRCSPWARRPRRRRAHPDGRPLPWPPARRRSAASPASGRCSRGRRVPMNDLFLRACRREPMERPPVWMMRQAGRYLPEYRAVRARADFLTMVRTPELAVEVTLQPVDLLGVDAAIIFSDILVVPQAMGMDADGGGWNRARFPRSAPRARATSSACGRSIPPTTWATCWRRVRLARAALAGRVPLIGFAGAPWTLMSYMVEGGGVQDVHPGQAVPGGAPGTVAHALLERLAASWVRTWWRRWRPAPRRCSCSTPGPRRWALATSASSRCRISRRRSGWRSAAGAPVIVFAPGAGWALEEIADRSGADVIGIDWQTDAAEARRRLASRPVALQGNLDPTWLYAEPASIRDAHARDARRVRRHGAHRQPGSRHPARRPGGPRAKRSSARCRSGARGERTVAGEPRRDHRSHCTTRRPVLRRDGWRRLVSRGRLGASRRRRRRVARPDGGCHVREVRRQPVGGRGQLCRGRWRSDWARGQAVGRARGSSSPE